MYHDIDGFRRADPPTRRARAMRPAVADLLIRAAGLAGIALAAAIVARLYRGMGEADLGRSLAAALAFLSASLGSGLLVMGRHLRDPVMLPDRWRPRSQSIFKSGRPT